MQPTPKKSYGCLKIGLIVFAFLFVLGWIASLISGEPTTNYSASYMESDSAGSAEIERRAVYEDSIRQEDEKEAIAKALKGLKVKKDEFENTAFYYGGSIPYVNTNRLYLYMPYKEGSRPGLRLQLQYAGDDWLFFNQVDVNADGRKMSLTGLGTVSRDNNGSKVWEWVDSDISGSGMDATNNLTVLRMIASSKKAVVRLTGKQYHKDRTLTEKEKKSIRDVLEAYDAVNDVMMR